MILEQIHTSGDLRKLSDGQLMVLADEIRHFLISHVAKTGGHLAANLGVVELTLALHQVFDVHYDRLIWDVGHQAYTHKILTGRGPCFDTLRQFGGLSGFPKTEEDESDTFNTGHSSTSISAAVGFAAAAKLRGENRTAVAVIGDGALTGGMAFEAMNHAGSMKIPLIVVLNDNGMSISKNVGGLSKRLKRIRNTRRYFEFKSNVKSVLDKIPLIGPPLKKRVAALKKALKPLIVHNVLFEDLGFTYLGPVDGHNIEELRVILRQAKKRQEPVLVHVHTKKGKGYLPAEKNPGQFHGVPSFDSKTGQLLDAKQEMDWSEYFGQTLCRLAEKDNKITAITAAMPLGTGLTKFQKMFPARFFDVGIAEQHAVTFAAGLAKGGMLPCLAVYSTFLQRAYDQLLHDVALQKLHVVFCIDRSGPVGRDGETHQGVFDISYLSHLPGFTILSPSNSRDFDRMLEYAFHICTGPVAIRYPRGTVLHPAWPEDQPTLDMQAHLRRDGDDILIAAAGTTVFDALKVADILEKHGIRVAVLDVGIIKPMDEINICKYCENKKMIASLEDNVVTGGFGQQLTVLLKKRVRIFAYPDEPIVQGSVNELKQKYGLTPEQIARELMKLVVW
ncbi:1-deoxy-D-xylulose-5-phosphate synthase [Ructibacterium gallinarum]|uniref:1-deoxy-D-xylulose-5-phosphate synthase n=1 Tax=Ructibacterium gallinarum TaxID=2779355 RepID=A0A9D5LWD6_9FIRM|nr:1-deoxy-D-xylulose-5-phosphate synthase [Ructibacterium gallinarum]MBE5038898.1 1-deoxy-D-xylulose-5-phosphate synthase [Ructibacterium gallinarum]